MSISIDNASSPVTRHKPFVSGFDGKSGSAGMLLFILTEAALFVMLFFSYIYIVRSRVDRFIEEPPKLHFAIPMLAVLLVSSGVLYLGEQQVQRLNYSRARILLLATILIGVGFLVLQFFEYRERLEVLSPRTNAYGSIFYTITSFHAVHLVLGLLMLSYVLILPRHEPTDRPPHRPYHNASLYWHFVDLVWIFIAAILYVAPNIGWL